MPIKKPIDRMLISPANTEKAMIIPFHVQGACRANKYAIHLKGKKAESGMASTHIHISDVDATALVTLVIRGRMWALANQDAADWDGC